MKRYLILLLLLTLLLLGSCQMAAGAETIPPAEEQTEPPVETVTETLPPETEAPETEPEPEPDAGLAGTVMELSAPVTLTPESPVYHLTVLFSEADLCGAPEDGRICTLKLRLDGTELLRRSVAVYPGAMFHAEVPVEFARYQDKTEAELELTLEYGGEALRAAQTLPMENWPDERWAAESGDRRPYAIDVLRNQNVVIVYGKDEAGDYSVPVKVFLCSTGRWTPTGTWSLGYKYAWRALFGGVYGQYACVINGNYLFHSVPYSRRLKDHLKTDEFNKLGTTASMGCIRLAVSDCKWIYDYCPSGTRVHIYNSDEVPVPLPEQIVIDPDDPRAGWDPTDPDPENPWLAEDGA